jgi:DNA modification methylase
MACLDDFQKITVGAATVFHGSNLDVLPFMADNSVDSIVCDPPYELGFMGKSWDSSGIAYSVDLWRECLRVLKPGGHLLAFSGSRTYHRMVVAIEDAGFEVRDMISWISNKTFPKSHNVSLSIDKHLGHSNRGKAIPVASSYQASDVDQKNKLVSNPVDDYAAKTDEAEKWVGWGTALKPTVEPVVMARKPLVGTVAENVLAWGVGGLNIDASRIEATDQEQLAKNWDRNQSTATDGVASFVSQSGVDLRDYAPTAGRWPANVIFDEDTAGQLDEQVEGVSRFFYVARATKRDRNEGLEELPETKSGSYNGNAIQPDGNKIGANPDRPNQPAQNFHPTVKPTDLMRYLIKLVTPAGGIVLDPFTGSGSTGKAALLDGYQFVGIELTADYLPIIEGRLRWAAQERREQVEALEAEEKETLF